jgi:hypothetical protein
VVKHLLIALSASSVPGTRQVRGGRVVLVGVLLGCLSVVTVVGTFAFALGRVAARADQLETKAGVAASSPLVDRRTDPVDRRAAGRAWESTSPGRRQEDILRAELAEAKQRLEEAEARLAVAESRIEAA